MLAHLQETEHPDLERFFDTEINHTDNLNTNMWNTPRFSNIYTSYFTTRTYSKEINKELFTDERNRNITSNIRPF